MEAKKLVGIGILGILCILLVGGCISDEEKNKLVGEIVDDVAEDVKEKLSSDDSEVEENSLSCEEVTCTKVDEYIDTAIKSLDDKNQLLDKKLINGVIKAESSYHQCCYGSYIGDTCNEGEILKSHKGALGLTQLMPSTASWSVLDVDPYNDEDNVKGCVKYLNWLLNTYFYRYNEKYGNREFTISAYNCGQGNVLNAIQKYCIDKNITRPNCTWKDHIEPHINEFCGSETKPYVNKIMKWYDSGNVECSN